MLASGQKADRLIRDLIAFARATPFRLTEVLTGAKQLLATGGALENIVSELRILGNVSAGLSVPMDRIIQNFGQIRARGRLTGAELRDFVRAGIPLMAELAKSTGRARKEIQSMVEAGDIGFDRVKQAFENMSSSGGLFFNLMERQSRSFFGQLEKLKDALDAIFRGIGKSLIGPVKLAISAMERFADTTEKLVGLTGSLLGNMLASVTAATSLAAAIAGLSLAMKTLGVSLQGLLIATGIFVQVVAIGAAIGLVVTIVRALTKELRNLIIEEIGIEGLTKIFDNFGEAARRTLNAIVNGAKLAFAAFREFFIIIGRFIGLDLSFLPETIAGAILLLSEFSLDMSKLIEGFTIDWIRGISAMKLSFETGFMAISDTLSNILKRMEFEIVRFFSGRIFKKFLDVFIAKPEIFRLSPETITQARELKRLLDDIAKGGILRSKIADEAAAKTLIESRGKTGAFNDRFGFAELGRKVQDAFQQTTVDPMKENNRLTAQTNTKLDQIKGVLERTQARPVVTQGLTAPQ